MVFHRIIYIMTRWIFNGHYELIILRRSAGSPSTIRTRPCQSRYFGPTPLLLGVGTCAKGRAAGWNGCCLFKDVQRCDPCLAKDLWIILFGWGWTCVLFFWVWSYLDGRQQSRRNKDSSELKVIFQSQVVGGKQQLWFSKHITQDPLQEPAFPKESKYPLFGDDWKPAQAVVPNNHHEETLFKIPSWLFYLLMTARMYLYAGSQHR